MVHLPLPSSWAPQSTLSYKPWLNEQDAEEVFFSSVHLYAGRTWLSSHRLLSTRHTIPRRICLRLMQCCVV
jgi:hypothetical protein